MTAVPRVSIGLPVYNGEAYLAESLDSLLGQSYPDFELIVSDNASTDGTADICDRYVRQDSRIRYFRQPRNIGCAPNHNFVLRHARGEFFNWVSCDDLYARDLIERCVSALDARKDVVLAASWTAAIDDAGNVTQAMKYPLATDSASAPERFASMLFGTGADGHGLIWADDDYGLVRRDVLRRIAPLSSYRHADKVIMAELALQGPFHHEPGWLYFRRDHPDRAQRACPTVRAWCVNLDPRRASRLRHPVVRLYAEYVLGYLSAIRHAPLAPADRRECYRHLARWVASRALPVASRAVRRATDSPATSRVPAVEGTISVRAVVAGWAKDAS